LVFSGHKMNAPGGVGAVVGRRDIFAAAAPYQPGGGTVASVSTNTVTWAAPPDRNEAGTPNILGMLALARTVQVLEAVGMDKVEAHERHLTSVLLEKLSHIPQVKILGSRDPNGTDKRVGVVTFTVDGVPHGLVAAILSYEWGIAVRNGCFCAQPLMKRLLGVEETCSCPSEEETTVRGDRHNVPGAVRASLGIHNTEQEMETLVEAVSRIAQKQWQGDYQQDATTGDYLPRGFRFDFSDLPGFDTEPTTNSSTSERHLKVVHGSL
jgi:cysteine desulfurase / selenocysteine lyase